MNLILAFFLGAVVVVGIGQSVAVPTLSSVTACLDATGVGTDCAAEGAEVSPAAAAGLRAGDTITAWDGAPIETWDGIVGAIALSGERTVTVEIERDGAAQSATITPRAFPAADGRSARVLVGVSAGQGIEHGSLGDVPGVIGSQIAMAARAYARLPVSVWQAGVDMVTNRERPVDSPISILGIARVSGEATARAAELSPADAWRARWFTWLSLGASLNLALWMFNLIPLLPLDGGHVAGAIIEGVRRTWARLRRRRERSGGGPAVADALPGPVDLVRAIPLTYAVFGLLIVMTLVLVLADIINPIRMP
jgi:membrane-associated protease RseP (regulator of RpoE activity)